MNFKIRYIKSAMPLALLLLASQVIEAKKEDNYTEKIKVTNTKDSGCGSLRWAIEKANKCSYPTDINFALRKSDKGYDCVARRWTIRTESSIEMTGPHTTIDGYSQKGSHPNTSAPDEPSNACVKILIQSPPVVSEETAKTFITYLSSLLTSSKGTSDAETVKEMPKAVRELIAKVVAYDSTKSRKNAILETSPLFLPITGTATIKGILAVGRVS